jgi:Tol biopolymer transport system component
MFDIWIANADGSEPAQLTHENGAAGTPRWTPDGKAVLFDLHTPDGEIDIFIIRAIGGPSQRLTRDPSEDTLPCFSRDGKWIYFNSNRSGWHQIWRMPAAGGEAQQITQKGANTALPSIDGETLYYSRSLILYAVPVAGGDEKKVVDLGHNRVFAVTGHGIYYIGRRRSDGRYELCLLDPSTSKNRVIAVLDGPIVQGLTVSPDGKTILYNRGKDSQSDLMLVENFR